MIKKTYLLLLSSLCMPLSISHAQADVVDSTLNDTGISWSGLIPSGTSPGCSDDTDTAAMHFIRQQDCYSGKDSKGSDSELGFSFIKLDKSGKKQAGDAKQWDCVLDQVSGLVWEVKKNDESLHRATDQFTWYNSDSKSNGGHIGNWNDRGNHCGGYQAGKPKTYCHTEQYVSRVNQVELCGYSDWRLPTRAELANLVHFGRIKPTVETNYFPHTQTSFYWTATSVSGRNKEAWAVSFEYGFSAPMPRDNARYVRLVRSDAE